jgi:predicted phosphoadenosine phosphosulfate sulfurtransferase
MTRVRQKEYIDSDVLEAAYERIRFCYQNYDKVIVSFSGGKDSTAVLNLTIQVARELNKLPVHAIFFDEEAIHPPTIEYVERVRNNPDVVLDWYCLPVKHRNACSNEQPYWYCWNPSEKHLWVRDLPAGAITEHENFSWGLAFQDFAPFMYGPEHGKVCWLTGIRTQESLRRYRVIASKRNDAFVNTYAEYKNCYKAYPIYDWSSTDVWKLVELFDLDYNHTYDYFNKTSMYEDFLHQRVCPPYGEEPLRGLWVYAECFPELWHKMLYRVPGVSTAWRYANTELYSNWSKPDGKTWRQYFDIILSSYDKEYQNLIKISVNTLIKQHYTKTDGPIGDEDAHPLSGASWKFFCKIAQKGDFKGRQKQNMVGEGMKVLEKMGLTLEEAKIKFGKK